MIQFVKSGNDAITKTREGYWGPWTEHGTLLKRGCYYPSKLLEDTKVRPAPRLTLSRVLHIRETIYPLLDEYARPW